MQRTEEILQQRLARSKRRKSLDPYIRLAAKRTAFIARFIVLREGRRSRAHRVIEEMCWDRLTTAEELGKRLRQAFSDNGDRLQPVDRDIKRALEHAEYSADYFSDQYFERAVLSFKDALADYERSNRMLFGNKGKEMPRSGGWRLPSEIGNSNTL